MTEDSSGQMWFGVRDGIVKYDGLRWETYKLDASTMGGQAESIASRTDGTIVVATSNGLFQLRQPDRQWKKLFPHDAVATFPTTFVAEFSERVTCERTRSPKL